MRVAALDHGPDTPLLRGMPHFMLVCLCAGLVLGVIVPAPWWGPVLVPVWAVAAIGRPRGAVLVGLAGLLVAGGWMWATGRAAQTSPAVITAAGDIRALAVVDASPRRRPTGGWRVTVRVAELRSGGDPGVRGARLLVWLRGTPPRVGEVVLLRGALRPAARDDAPGWWLRYLERQRISGAVATGRLPVLGRRGGPAGARDRASEALRARIGDRLDGPRGALVQGMALGGSDGLDPETEEQVRDAGLAHLLAVSGQNVAVVGLVIAAILRAAGAPRPAALAVVAPMVVLYCLLCEPGASVARAGVVAVAAILAEGLARARDRWYLLLLALTGLLAWQPRSDWDPGLQLSFAAVVGILAIGPPLRRALAGVLPGWMAELAGVAGAAGLATAPVLVADFGRVSIAGFATNLVAVPLASAVLVTGLAGAVSAPLPGPVADIVIHLAGLGADAILLIARTAAGVPGASVALPSWCAPLAAAPALAVWLLDGGRYRCLVGWIGGPRA